LLEYSYRGRLPEVKQQIVDMSLNASSVRDTARVLRISTDTVLRALRKKEAALESVNTALLRTVDPDEMLVDIQQAGEAEMDEMWSFVGNKGNPRWLWHAIDHHTGAVLAYVFGRRKDEVFLHSKRSWSPLASPATTPIIGARTAGIWTPTCIARANAIRRKSSANI
jgi:insertion element IS1 protein InsB